MAQKKQNSAPRDRGCRSVALELRNVGEDGVFEGYGSVFGVEDSYDEVVAPGAFSDSLKAHRAAGTMPALLWQHRADKPIGIYTEMEEDKRGLRVRGQLALETELGREAYALLKMGALNGLSIGFRYIKSEYDEDTGIRTLNEVELWEVSLVTFPANGDARIDEVRTTSISTERDLEQLLREVGCSKSEARASVRRVREHILSRREADADVAKAQAASDRLLKTLNS